MGGKLKTAKQIHYRSESFRRNILGEKFKELRGGFLGDPVAETPGSQCRRPEFHTWSGN